MIRVYICSLLCVHILFSERKIVLIDIIVILNERRLCLKKQLKTNKRMRRYIK
jgi:hypothetical protein